MAILSCPECGGKVSDKAECCPHCGCPAQLIIPKEAELSQRRSSSDVEMNSDTSIYGRTVFGTEECAAKCDVPFESLKKAEEVPSKVITQKEFCEYLVSYPAADILPRIKEIYFDLKGSCKSYPHLGENGCKEMAGMLMLWDFIYQEKIKKTIHEYDELFFMLMFNFGIACHGVPAGKWSDMMDITIENSPILLSDWNESYTFFDENYDKELNHCIDRSKSKDPTYMEELSQITDLSEKIIYVEQNLFKYDFEFAAPSSIETDRTYSEFCTLYESMANAEDVLIFFRNRGLNFSKYISWE